MKRPYKAINIAKYIITKCTRDGYSISNLQLQKILYILQKEYLQRDQKCLFFDDFEAWDVWPEYSKRVLLFLWIWFYADSGRIRYQIRS